MRCLFIVFILLFGCKSNSESDFFYRKFFVDFTVNNLLVPKVDHFDICGKFNDEYTFEEIKSSLEQLDSIFSPEDIDCMLDQYSEYKGTSIDRYIDEINSLYKKEGENYNPSDSIMIHFSLTVPMISLNKEYAVIFNIASPIRVNSYKDGFFYLIKIDEDNIKLVDIIKNEYTTPKENKHHHEYSFVYKR